MHSPLAVFQIVQRLSNEFEQCIPLLRADMVKQHIAEVGAVAVHGFVQLLTLSGKRHGFVSCVMRRHMGDEQALVHHALDNGTRRLMRNPEVGFQVSGGAFRVRVEEQKRVCLIGGQTKFFQIAIAPLGDGI